MSKSWNQAYELTLLRARMTFEAALFLWHILLCGISLVIIGSILQTCLSAGSRGSRWRELEVEDFLHRSICDDCPIKLDWLLTAWMVVWEGCPMSQTWCPKTIMGSYGCLPLTVVVLKMEINRFEYEIWWNYQFIAKLPNCKDLCP